MPQSIQYNIASGMILGTIIVLCMGASKALVIQFQKVPFDACDTFYAPMHTIGYFEHERECCMRNIALKSRAIFLIQQSPSCYNYYIIYVCLSYLQYTAQL